MENRGKYFLKSKRLGFRKWKLDDLDLAFGLWGDLEVTKLIDVRGQLSKEQVREKLIKEIETDRAYEVQYWPIFLLENNEHVGCCGLRPYEVNKNIYEIGFHIRSNYWGKGFAKESALTVMDYAFKILKASALFAGHNPSNVASKKLLEKLGFKYIRDEFYEPTELNHPSYLLTVEEYSNVI